MGSSTDGSAKTKILTWAAVSIIAALVVFAVVLPTPCPRSQECSQRHLAVWSALNRYAVCALTTALVLEVAALRLTYKSAKVLVGMVAGIEHTFVPPVLLSVTFAVLILENLFVSSEWLVHAAAPGVGFESGRPVYTVVYVEWLINVPILLALVGSCALWRPLSEVSRPLIVTNLYIIIAWAAHFLAAVWLRWALVAAAFAMYGWASCDMARWVFKFRSGVRKELPSQNLRCALSFGLIAVFGFYGVVFLLSFQGLITSHEEMIAYVAMNFLVKLIMLMCFVDIRSSQFYDMLAGLLVNKNTMFARQIAVANDFAEFEPASSLPLLQ